MMERNINTNRDDTFRGFEIWATVEYILVSFFSNNGRWKKCEYHFIIVTLTDSIRLQVNFSICNFKKCETRKDCF